MFLAYYDRSVWFQTVDYSITIRLIATLRCLLLAIACGFLVRLRLYPEGFNAETVINWCRTVHVLVFNSVQISS